MKKTIWKMSKCLCCLTLLVTLLTAAVLSVGASYAMESTPEYMTWTLSENGETLTDGDGSVYTRYELPFGYRLSETTDVYAYTRRAANENGDSNPYVYSFARGGSVVWLSDRAYDATLYTFYGTENGCKALDDLVKGNTSDYKLLLPASYGGDGEDLYATLSRKLANAVAEAGEKNEGEKVTYPMFNLVYKMERMEILAYDRYGVVCTTQGAVYDLGDGRYGYLHYPSLDSTYFTADGYLSSRGHEEAQLLILEKTLCDQLVAVSEEAETVFPETVYEQYDLADGYVDPYYDEAQEASFWVFLVFFGYLVPIAPLTVGLVFAHSKKMSHPKRWYVLAGMAALWILLSILLTVLLLV